MGKKTWEFCHACRHNPSRLCHVTPDLLQLLERDTQQDEPESTAYTPSRLTGCDRQAELTAHEDYYEDLRGAWPLVRGTMIHAILERSGKVDGTLNTIREVRLTTQIEVDAEPVEIGQDFNPTDVSFQPGQEPLSGKADLIVLGEIRLPEFPGQPTVYRCKIVDYKTSTVDNTLIAAHKSHIMQVNLYKWLVERELPAYLGENIRVEVTELEILYLGYSRTRRFTSACALTDQLLRVKEGKRVNETITLDAIPLLSNAVIEEWIRRRIQEKRRAKIELPPILSGERAWMCVNCPVRDVCFAKEREEQSR